MNNTNLSNISTQINNDDLITKGYIIFKQAIKNPEIYLKKLEKDLKFIAEYYGILD